MNLFFRLLRVFVRALFAPKPQPLLDTYSLNYRVWLTDQDMFMHMTNSRYLSFSDLGTINLIIRTGFWGILRKRGWFPVICGQSMTISRMLNTPNKFQLVTEIVGWTGTYVGISHKFIHQGREHAEVRVIARFASRNKQPVPPQSVVDALDDTVKSPALPKPFLDLIDDIEAARAAFRESKKNTNKLK